MFCCVHHPLSQSIHQFSRSDPTISVQIPHFWRVFVRRRTFWQHGETFVNKKSCLRSLTWNFPRWSRINSNCFLIVVSFLSGSYLIIPQKTEQKDEHTLEEGYSSYVAVGLYPLVLGVWCRFYGIRQDEYELSEDRLLYVMAESCKVQDFNLTAI